MLQNAYLLAKIGADTAENEQHFAEICRDRDADGVVDRRCGPAGGFDGDELHAGAAGADHLGRGRMDR